MSAVQCGDCVFSWSPQMLIPGDRSCLHPCLRAVFHKAVPAVISGHRNQQHFILDGHRCLLSSADDVSHAVGPEDISDHRNQQQFSLDGHRCLHSSVDDVFHAAGPEVLWRACSHFRERLPYPCPHNEFCSTPERPSQGPL